MLSKALISYSGLAAYTFILEMRFFESRRISAYPY